MKNDTGGIVSVGAVRGLLVPGADAAVLPATFPLPVEITHVVTGPIDLGDRAAARRSRRALRELHARVWRLCQSMLDNAVAQRARRADGLDRTVRAGERILQRVGV